MLRAILINNLRSIRSMLFPFEETRSEIAELSKSSNESLRCMLQVHHLEMAYECVNRWFVGPLRNKGLCPMGKSESDVFQRTSSVTKVCSKIANHKIKVANKE